MSLVLSALRGLRPLALVLAFALPAGFAAQADEARPFPQPQITAEQWQTFFEEVKAKPGANDITDKTNTESTAIAVQAEASIYYFTKPGPAYPAIVILHLIEQQGGIAVERIGYYAGSLEEFTKWYTSFAAVEDAVRKRAKSPHKF